MSAELQTVIVNEAGEIEYLPEEYIDIVDTTLGTVSHEVEVVTVDDFRRRLRNSTSTTQSIVKPLVTPLLSSSSSSPSGPTVLRSTPTLLRNSRTSLRPPQTIVTQAASSPSSQHHHVQIQNVNSFEFLPVVQQLAAAHSSQSNNPSSLPPASSQILRAVDPLSNNSDGPTQLIVYNCGDTQFDIIEQDNVQLRLCEVLQGEGDEDGEQNTIYICEQDEPTYVDADDEYSSIQVVEELPILQDEEGNVYEVEQFDAGQFGTHPHYEVEYMVPMPIKKRRKIQTGRTTVTNALSAKVVKKPLNELRCMEPDCFYKGVNILELRKHLNQIHDLAFDEEVLSFSSDKEFKAWRETYERERMVSFIFRGGTKKVSRDQAVTYLICHRSGHYKPTMKDQSLRKRKMKPQGSCKMNGYCTAGIKVLKSLETGEIRCEICHTHYGHPLDNGAIPHLRVNNVLRKIIFKKFEEGMSFNQVVQYLHHNPDRLEGLRVLDRRAVRNIYDKYRKNPYKAFLDDDSDDDGSPNSSTASPSSAEKKDNEGTPSEDVRLKVEMEVEINGTQNNDENTAVHVEESENTVEIVIEKSPEEPTGEKTGKSDTEDTVVEIIQDPPPEIRPPAKKRGRKPKAKTVVEEKIVSLEVDKIVFPSEVQEESVPSKVEASSTSIRRSARERKPKLFPDDEQPKRYARVKVEPNEKSTDSSPSPATKNISTKKAGRPPSKYAKRGTPVGDTQSPAEKTAKENLPEEIVSAPLTAVSGETTDNEPVVLVSNVSENEMDEDNKSKEGQEVVKEAGTKESDKEVTEIEKEIELNDEVPDVRKTTKEIIKPKEEKAKRTRSSKVKHEASESKSNNSGNNEVITEGLKATIENLLQHGESGPTVLMYKKPGSCLPEYGRKDPRLHKDDFILVLQTPVQRQLMQMFSDVVSMDCHKGRTKDLKLMWVLVLDEFREAIPVAWLITNSVDDRIISIFLKVLHSHTLDLPTSYVQAPNGYDYCQLWSNIFKCNPKLLLSDEETRRDMRIEVAETFADNTSRRKLNALMSDLMTACHQSAFENLVDEMKRFLEDEHGDKGKSFWKAFHENWLTRAAEWDLVHRVAAPVNTMYVSEAFGKLKKFIAFKGTKILNSCIDPVLKIGYDKCFSRSKRVFKGDQKLLKIMEDMDIQHTWASEMNPENFEMKDEYTYLIKDTTKNMTYTVFDIQSPCRCKYVCPKCQVCLHRFICTCHISNVDRIMCSHTHFARQMTLSVTIPTINAASTAVVIGHPHLSQKQLSSSSPSVPHITVTTNESGVVSLAAVTSSSVIHSGSEVHVKEEMLPVKITVVS